MKVAIAVDDFRPDKGYLEYYLAKELSELGHRIFVLTFGLGKDASRAILNEGFEVVALPSLLGHRVPSFRALIYAAKFIKAEKPQIIHCGPLVSPLSLILVAWGPIFKYKTVGPIMTQLFSSWSLKDRLQFHLSRILVKLYAERLMQIIVVKDRAFMKTIMRAYSIPARRFVIIPLGADPELFKFDRRKRVITRRKLGLSNRDIVIVYSGKVNESKGLDVLFKASSDILAQDARVKILIVGNVAPSYLECFDPLVSDLKNSSRVILHRAVHRTKLVDFYSASDIAVWPGLSSISIVEAASVGLPLVIARSPVEIYAVMGGNGFTFGPGDVDELRKRLETLIYDSKLRKDMGRKSRALVEKKLNWNTIALQYLDLYNRALQPRCSVAA